MKPAQYPARYKIQDVERQLEILKGLWPSLDIAPAQEYAREILPGLPIPKNAEGLFCIVNPAFFGKDRLRAVQEVLKVLGQRAGETKSPLRARKGTSNRFANEFAARHGGEIGEEIILPRTHTTLAERAIALHQPGSVWIIPAQFGRLHRNHSANAVRKALADENGMPGSEFGLGIAAVGCMVLTHPYRFISSRPLQAECMGDRVALKPMSYKVFQRAEEPNDAFRRRKAKAQEETFNYTPYFGLNNLQLFLDAASSDSKLQTAGVVTGFVPHH